MKAIPEQCRLCIELSEKRAEMQRLEAKMKQIELEALQLRRRAKRLLCYMALLVLTVFALAYAATRLTANSRIISGMGSLAGVMTAMLAERYVEFRRSHGSRTSEVSRQSKSSILYKLRFFFPRDSRDDIDFLVADLRKDEREMQAKGLAPAFICLVMSWHTARVVTPYLRDGLVVIIKGLIPLQLLVKMFGKG